MIGLTIASFLFVPFLFELTQRLYEKGKKILNVLTIAGVGFSVLTLVGLVMVALSPADVFPIAHVIGAIVVLFGSLEMSFYFSISIFFSKKVPKWRAALGFLVPIILGVLLVMDIVVVLQNIPHGDIIGMINSSLIFLDEAETAAIIRLSEWILIFTVFTYLAALVIELKIK